MKQSTLPCSVQRRRLLRGAAALAVAPSLSASAAPGEMPNIPALAAYLDGRTLKWQRVRLELPRLADNGLAVPMKVSVDGPFTPAQAVRSVRLFSEKNPV